MKLVISLGGSLITENFTAEKIKSYAKALQTISTTTDRLVVVTGGGKLARDYIKIIKGIGMDQPSQDKIAIQATHLNARLIAMALSHTEQGIANNTIPETEKDIETMLDKHKILVCGGTIPGQSTDSVSAKIAKSIKADLLINASNIDGVYDSDPKKNKNAKKHKTLTYDELTEILSKNEQSPGKYALFDKQAAKIIKEQKIKTIIINGNNPEELIKATNETHSGTTIQ